MTGRGRIGHGQRAKPDVRAEMPAAGIAPSRSGPGAPWTPSPMAATLPAAHRVDVRGDVARAGGRGRRSPCRISACRRLRRAPKTPSCGRRRRVGSTTAPRASAAMWRAGDRLLQGARHRRRALTENRAACRIRSPYRAGRLAPGVRTEAEGEDALRAAAKVDGRNAADPGHRPMAPDFDGPALLPARGPTLFGARRPSGHAEPVRHARRLQARAARA